MVVEGAWVLKIVFENGNVLVGDGSVITNASILVEGKKIADVDTSIRPPSGSYVIDCAGKTIMPGLFDCHYHSCTSEELKPTRHLPGNAERQALLATRNVRKELHAGFTTIKDAGSTGYLNIYLRDMINAGWIEGPRIVATCFMTMSGGHGSEWTGIDGPIATRRMAREFIAHKADVIKCAATGGVDSPTAPGAPAYTIDEMAAAFEEAHNVGKRTCVHAYGAQGIKNAIEAGVDCIDHGNLMDEACIDLMVKQGIYHIPTVALRPLREHNKEKLPQTVWEKSMVMLRHMRETRNMENAFKAGVPTALGSDWPEGYGLATHGDSALEFKAMIDLCGMTAMEAITAATKTSAECLGLDRQLGTLEVGKLADILVVDGNPYECIELLTDQTKIQIVMKEGEFIKRRAL
jgi:imidazolonepropionase-like amidohydrolase